MNLLLWLLWIMVPIYIILGWAQYTISQKLKIENAWFAWIPILSIYNYFQISGKVKQSILLIIIMMVATTCLIYNTSTVWTQGIGDGIIQLICYLFILICLVYIPVSTYAWLLARTGHRSNIWWIWLIFPMFFLPIIALTTSDSLLDQPLGVSQDTVSVWKIVWIFWSLFFLVGGIVAIGFVILVWCMVGWPSFCAISWFWH